MKLKRHEDGSEGRGKGESDPSGSEGLDLVATGEVKGPQCHPLRDSHSWAVRLNQVETDECWRRRERGGHGHGFGREGKLSVGRISDNWISLWLDGVLDA